MALTPYSIVPLFALRRNELGTPFTYSLFIAYGYNFLLAIFNFYMFSIFSFLFGMYISSDLHFSSLNSISVLRQFHLLLLLFYVNVGNFSIQTVWQPLNQLFQIFLYTSISKMALLLRSWINHSDTLISCEARKWEEPKEIVQFKWWMKCKKYKKIDASPIKNQWKKYQFVQCIWYYVHWLKLYQHCQHNFLLFVLDFHSFNLCSAEFKRFTTSIQYEEKTAATAAWNTHTHCHINAALNCYILQSI